MSEIDRILHERGARYGSFEEHATITQELKVVMRNSLKWVELSHSAQEALDMIAHKIGRILNGDPTYQDSWVDIIGYAQLELTRLKQEEFSRTSPSKRSREEAYEMQERLARFASSPADSI